MSFPNLTFPLTVDFCNNGYWINDQGPFKYGAATTAFFIGEDFVEAADDGIPLMRELEQQLQAFGSHLKPYVREMEVDADLFLNSEDQAVRTSMCFVFHPIEDSTGVSQIHPCCIRNYYCGFPRGPIMAKDIASAVPYPPYWTKAYIGPQIQISKGDYLMNSTVYIALGALSTGLLGGAFICGCVALGIKRGFKDLDEERRNHEL